VLFSSFFWQGAALGLSAAATPGSLQTLLISEMLLGGFKRGARITLAPLITDAPIINWLNPNPYLFWTLVGGPTLIAALNQSLAYGAAFLVGMYGVFIAGMLIIAAVFHFARNLGPRIVHGMLLISIGVLTMLGVVLLAQGLVG
jgi:threonine/homoserine/homoserine lactone efflux protein